MSLSSILFLAIPITLLISYVISFLLGKIKSQIVSMGMVFLGILLCYFGNENGYNGGPIVVTGVFFILVGFISGISLMIVHIKSSSNIKV
ncbi:hypothetical protein [Peribacillus acanthi]|uniref:hypothetical protein n=1 Tax=Peribacillus acanthi TaxID=2171554 RepID=UPI000D3E8BD0|nr:hypothetical protein [Peribacillus acanthi]